MSRAGEIYGPLTGDDFYERTGMRTVDVVSGGFPCQPFSVAGKRRGKEDDRFLWPEMLRIIKELRPAWVVGENVAGIISMAIDQVLSDLESIGYTCQAFVIPACAVDARTGETGAQLWPTARSKESGDYQYSRGDHNKPTPTLSGAVKMWPTPTAGKCGMTAKTSGRPIEKSTHLSTQVYLAERLWTTPTAADSTGTTEGGNSRSLRTDVGGQLNPTWVEWLMGFPTGWTDLNA